MVTPNLEAKNSSSSSNNDKLSADEQEKIRLKKEKLAQWKLKKQAKAKTETNSPNDKTNEIKNETPEEEKIRLRREKLQAWKKKKQKEEEIKQSASASASVSPSPGSTSSPGNNLNGIKLFSSKATPFGGFKKVSQSEKIKSKLGLFSKSIGLKRKAPFKISKIDSFSNENILNDSGIQKRQKLMDFESTDEPVTELQNNTSKNNNEPEADDLDLFMSDIKKHATELDAKSENKKDSTDTINLKDYLNY
ncbi:unnamed protein product [[Candida] boidinii]|nr:unnamed protein product [[Candida] boidinii]